MRKKITKKPTPVQSSVPSVQTDKIKKSIFKDNLPFILVGVLAFVLVAIKLIKGGFGVSTQQLKTTIIPNAVKKMVNDPNTKVEVANIKETSGVYEFELKLSSSAQKYTSYITKDGKIIFASGIKLADLEKTKATQEETKKMTCNDVKKADKSNLTAFIVSNCPYGIQMQRVIKKVIAEAPDTAANIVVRYIGSIAGDTITSMHGEEEAKENLRQICIREEQKEKYWPYVSCYMQEGKTDDCMASVGVAKSDIDACTTDANRGLKYAKVDFDMATKLNVSGSPTLIMNDSQTVSEFDFGGRNPNAIKELVCCGSKTKGEYCQKEISKNDVAVSLSKTDEVAESETTTSNAGCAPAK